MRVITQIARVAVGLLFIFSGFIKSNDPTGFSYKLKEYFTVFASDFEPAQDSFELHINGNSTEFKGQLLPIQTQYDLVWMVSSWSEQIITDSLNETSDTFYTTTANIFADGQTVFETELRATDTGDQVGEFSIAFKVADKAVESQTFAVEFPNAQTEQMSIDVSSYIVPATAMTKFFNWLKNYALFLAIFLCVLEIILGWALLIGWAKKFTWTLLFLMIVFFTFLTGYSAYFNKVTDCGCFGDAIKLTPWESFYKDLILLALIMVLLIGLKYIKPLFSKAFSIRFMAIVTVLFTSFSIYCWHYLPVINFLPYKAGNNLQELMEIPEGELAAPHKIMTYIYNDGSKDVVVEFDTKTNKFEPAINSEWTFVKVGEEIVLEEAYEPPVHDFHLYEADMSTDHLSELFANEGYQLLVVMHQLNDTREKSMKRIKEIAKWAGENNIQIMGLTASTPEGAETFRHDKQLAFPIYFGDDTNLKSIIRSNPGLVLMKGPVVVDSWPGTRLPRVKKLQRITQ